MKRFEQFDDSKDFWKTFPELLTYEIFSEFKEAHEDSSKKMWTIHKCEHPKSALFKDANKYSLPSIAKALEDIAPDLLAKVIERHREVCLSVGEAQLIRWKTNLDAMQNAIETALKSKMDVKEKAATATLLDKVLKMFIHYDDIMDKLREEGDKLDEKSSLTQSGLI